jgi:uncharacterized protein (TIGR02145 family)
MMSLKNPQGRFVTTPVVDTMGNTANVRIVLHECQDIKKLRIQITNIPDNSIEYDTVYNFVSCNATDSLITFSRVYSSAGSKEITAVGTMGDFTTKGTSIRFTILPRPAVNKAPKWDIKEIVTTVIVGTDYILTLQDTCSDPNSDILSYSLIPSSKGSINGTVYKYTPAAADPGLQTAKLVVKDAGFADTLTIRFTVVASDTAVPTLDFLKVVNDSITVTTATSTICAIVKDDTGIDSVIAMTGTAKAKVLKVNDTIWSIETGALTANASTPFVVTAFDKSGRKNGKIVFVKYVPPVVDSKAPVIKPVYPLTDTMSVSAPAVDIIVSCSDETGVDSVIAKMGINNLLVVPGTGIEYSIKVKGLVAGKNKVDIIVKDKAGNSTPGTITINYDPTLDIPIIVKEPENQHVVTGNRAVFTIAAQGSNLKYQWYRDTIIIPEATGTTYSTPIITANDDSMSYRCVVSNSGGAVTSTVARVVVNYTITYMGNGNTGGTAPVDTNRYTKGEHAAVKKNTGTLTCTGFLFGGWNTKSDGTGINYDPSKDAVIPITSNIVLYASWIPVYTVTFDAQGATNDVYPKSKTTDENSTIGVLPSAPAKTSYVFAGWWTMPNGEGVQVNEKTVIKAHCTVFAKWEIRDIDGNVYTEVKIGDQVWMVENLRTTKYRDGTPILYDTSSATWISGEVGKYCFYNNTTNIDTIRKFGALYNWYAVDTKKLAPLGWHVPDSNEVVQLQNYLIQNGYNADGKRSGNSVAKALASKTDWVEDTTAHSIGRNLNENNKTGFSAYPAGARGDVFASMGSNCWFWITTKYPDDNLFGMWFHLTNTSAEMQIGPWLRFSGFSVRAVRDW